MVINGGRSVNEIARDLGINSNLPYRWKRELTKEGGHAFSGKGRLSPQEEELRRLRRELAEAKEDREILKKPWNSSPKTARKVSVRGSTQRKLVDWPHVPPAEPEPQRVICLIP